VLLPNRLLARAAPIGASRLASAPAQQPRHETSVVTQRLHFLLNFCFSLG